MGNEGSLACLHHSSLILKATANRGHFMEQQHCRGLAKKWDAQLQPNPSSLGSTLLYFEQEGINCVVSRTKKMEKQCRACSVVASSSSSSIWQQLLHELVVMASSQTHGSRRSRQKEDMVPGSTEVACSCSPKAVFPNLLPQKELPRRAGAAVRQMVPTWIRSRISPSPLGCPKSLGRASHSGDLRERGAHGRQQPLCPRESWQKSTCDQLLNTFANKADDWKCHFAASWQQSPHWQGATRHQTVAEPKTHFFTHASPLL